MTNVAIIRCENNMDRCPLTNCFRCLMEKKEGFAIYEDCIPAGVFTCRCPGDVTVNLSKILKAKGAEVIHFCTCTFAKKTTDGWVAKDGGFCERHSMCQRYCASSQRLYGKDMGLGLFLWMNMQPVKYKL